MYLAALVVTALMAFPTAPIIPDYDNLFSYNLPSEPAWSAHLAENDDEIEDGSRDVDFLNACYRGGWNRCLSNFRHGYTEWDFYWLKDNKPFELGGNMADTDRVAGQLGWEQCTNRLRIAS